jgi:hypothetical protein
MNVPSRSVATSLNFPWLLLDANHLEETVRWCAGVAIDALSPQLATAPQRACTRLGGMHTMPCHGGRTVSPGLWGLEA